MLHGRYLVLVFLVIAIAGGVHSFAYDLQGPEHQSEITVSSAFQKEALLEPEQPQTKSEETPRKINPNPVVVNSICHYNDAISYPEARNLAHLIQKTAKRYNVDPLLVTALVSQESAFRADAVSPVGAVGLGQLMPFTAQDLGVNPWDPAENLDGCVRYLSQNLNRWRHSSIPVALALASYNAGPGAVSYYGGIPPYAETRHYVRTIRGRYQALRARHLAYQKARRSGSRGHLPS